MSPLTQAVVSIAAVLLIGNALILAHELGHYGTARLLGVTASRFTIGIGPTLIYRRDARGTEWKLALLPVGGVVSFPGEHDRSKEGSYAAQLAANPDGDYRGRTGGESIGGLYRVC